MLPQSFPFVLGMSPGVGSQAFATSPDDLFFLPKTALGAAQPVNCFETSPSLLYLNVVKFLAESVSIVDTVLSYKNISILYIFSNHVHNYMRS